MAAPGENIEGLAANPSTGLVYGIGNTTSLLVYNPGTTSWSTIGDTGTNWDSGGLAFDTEQQMLYVIGDGGGDNLYTLNPSTAAAALVGPTGITPTYGGLAFIGEGGAEQFPAFPSSAGAASPFWPRCWR